MFLQKYARASVDKSRTHLVKQTNAELTAALGPALNSLMKDGVRPSEMLQHLDTLREKLAQAVNKNWRTKRGGRKNIRFHTVRHPPDTVV